MSLTRLMMLIGGGPDRAGRSAEADDTIEAWLRDHFHATAAPAGDAAERVLSRLMSRPLPPQRRARLTGWWPSALLTSEFAPAWPRLAVLAVVAALGFALGSLDFARMHDRNAPTPLGFSATEGELGGILFDEDV